MADKDTLLDKRGDLLLHLFKRGSINDIRFADTGNPRPPVCHLLTGLHKGVEEDVAVVVDEGHTRKCRLGTHVSHSHHFAIDSDIVAGAGDVRHVLTQAPDRCDSRPLGLVQDHAARHHGAELGQERLIRRRGEKDHTLDLGKRLLHGARGAGLGVGRAGACQLWSWRSIELSELTLVPLPALSRRMQCQKNGICSSWSVRGGTGSCSWARKRGASARV